MRKTSGSATRSGAVVLLALTAGLLAFWLTQSYPKNDAGGGITAQAFTTGLDAMVAAGDTGRRIDGTPVVHPKPGDIYIRAVRWAFYPALELDPGQSYRLYLMSEDGVHSAVVAGREVMLLPGQVQMLPLRAPEDGRVPIQCGEYCGLGHSKMIGSIEVVPSH
jgi:heme/copper-type cytochrome/quinol oxidase subunit 2